MGQGEGDERQVSGKQDLPSTNKIYQLKWEENRGFLRL